MRVGLDATALRPGAVGGIRTASWLLLDACRKHAPELEMVALAPGPAEVPRGVEVVQTGGPLKPRRWRRSRALRLAARRLDLFHSPFTAFPSLRGLPVTATVHELPFIADYRLEGQARALAEIYWLTRAMRECRALVAPSRATLRQLRLAHPAAPRMTRVVPHPAPPAPAGAQRRNDGSLLFVGRLDRRKCVDGLLEGAVDFEGEIRLVGPHPDSARMRVRDVSRRLGMQERVRFCGLVDPETLDRLYRSACVVGLVSLSEGFGFPVLEALSRSVPVIVARGTGAAEVGGDAVLVVDPTDAREVAAALGRVGEEDYRREIACRGPARALDFSPERTARGYVEVFSRAVGG